MRLNALSRRLSSDERGFTMVTVMSVVFCVTLLSIAALSAAQGDLRPGAHDTSRKVAYAAAEAGVQNYVYHLVQDPNYWAKCTTGSQPHAINDPWNGTSPALDPRAWAALPNSAARYTIELLPANNAAKCSTALPDGTMIDRDSGTFKIRATGQAREGGVKRSIIATFKRQSLLDFLYLTDKETINPELYPINVDSLTTRETGGAGRDIVTWARQQCDRYWGDDPLLGGRAGESYIGESKRPDGSWAPTPAFTCSAPLFKSGDVIRGPFHTNDEILIDCATPAPQFGASIDDVVETSSLGQPASRPVDPRGGWRQCASSEPHVNFPTGPVRQAGRWSPRAAPLTLPLTNLSLKTDAAASYRFKGTTKIKLQATTMLVTGTRLAADSPPLVDESMAIPADGVVYVANDGACGSYSPQDAYAAPPTCGNLELEGNYATNVTFTAENDIVIKGDVTRTDPDSPFLLGLIASNYVRVYHPVTGCTPAGSPLACNVVTNCTNVLPSPRDVTIHAAILSLTRSMLVDNWFCGAALGNLHIKGAIAQMHRGPTGRESISGPHGSSGYTKQYVYDTRLKYRSPPHFLDPVNAQWRVQTFSEQVPAR